MQPERWQKCAEIFNTALEQPTAERGDFIERSCAGDEGLRRQVELLLKYHSQADGFIELPAFASAPDLLFGDNDALIGEQLGFYRIESVLGVGGMGVVYLAEDERLGRKVGLKLLPLSLAADVEQLEKLKLEARTASALNHPNIVTIHEIGEVGGTHYLTTEYIEGITLRERMNQGPIQLTEAIDIAEQIASALMVAHAAGIVHRDIKPENVMLRPDGLVKILDFGIAKFAPAEVPRPIQNVTQNLIIGTARYMSPEQARGLPVDGRSDIWSLGVLLYEMVAGHPPFSGETNTDVITSVLHKDPPPPARSTPRSLWRIIRRCLAREARERFPTAAELRERLLEVQAETSSTRKHARETMAVFGLFVVALAAVLLWRSPNQPSFSGRPSIAVLPFQNLSTGTSDVHFAEGVEDEILTRLSKIGGLRVISRTSTQKYQSKPDDVKKIGRELNVAHLVEGNVQKLGRMVRVNVQLIRADRDEHLWAETYTRSWDDIFKIEGDIAGAIAQQLKVKLTGTEEKAVADQPTRSAAAYEAYRRGLALESAQPAAEAPYIQAALEYEKAVAADPKFVLAWARLGMARSFLNSYLVDTKVSSPAMAKAAVDEAMRLGPERGESWSALGSYRYRVLRDYRGALQAFEEARRHLPNDSVALLLSAFLERRLGQWDKALEDCRQVISLDPRNLSHVHSAANSILIPLRRFTEAQQMFDRELEIVPHDEDVMADKAFLFQAQGRLTEASEQLSQIPSESTTKLVLITRIRQMALERRFSEAADQLQSYLTTITAEPRSPLAGDTIQLMTELGFLQDWAGRTSAARETFTQVVAALAHDPPEQLPITPKRLPCYLALAYAGLGEKDQALGHAQRALEDYRGDTVDQPFAEIVLAQIQARFGERDAALAALPQLLQAPGGLTTGALRFDPLWDPLRHDARFQKLVATNTGTRSVAEKSIAVLPFTDLSPQHDQQYLSDGMAEEILNALAHVKNLKVAGRTSSFSYRDGKVDLPSIGSALGVATILEGSVRKQGNKVRITAQLLQASDGFHLWSETYDGDVRDLFTLQERIARAITGRLQIVLEEKQRTHLVREATSSPEAYRLFLQASAIFNRRESGRFADAVSQLNEALRLDPDFARAHARLASICAIAPGYDVPLADDTAIVRREADAAIRLDPSLAEAHAAMGNMLFHQRHYADARAAYERALQIDPDDITTNFWLGSLLNTTGYIKESARLFEKVLAHDPMMPNALLWRGWAHLQSGEIDQAERSIRRAADAGLTPVGLGFAHVADARGERAQVARWLDPGLEHFLKDLPRDTAKAVAQGSVGNQADRAAAIGIIERYLASQPEVISGAVPLALIWLGQSERALSVAQDRPTRNDTLILCALWTPTGRSARQDPAFPTFLKRIGLAEFWDKYGPPDFCSRAGNNYVCK